MLKRIMLLACLMLLSGFSAQAKSRFTARLGDYGISNVSEMTQFFTGNAKSWKNKGIQVYSVSGNRRFRKTNWRMKHLPKGALYTIDADLVPVKTVTLHVPTTADHLCSSMSFWKCLERLHVLNPATSGDTAIWTVPEFLQDKDIPNPPAPPVQPPPAKQPVQIPWWDNVPILQTLSLLLFILSLILVIWLTMLLKMEPVSSGSYAEGPCSQNPPQGEERETLLSRMRNRYRVFQTSPERTSTADRVSETTCEQTTAGPASSPQSPLGLSSLPAESPFPQETERELQARARKIVPAKKREELAQQTKTKLSGYMAERQIIATIDTFHWPIIELRVPEDQADETQNVLCSVSDKVGIKDISSKPVRDTEKDAMLRLFELHF